MSHFAEAWHAINTHPCTTCEGRGWTPDPSHPYRGGTCRTCAGAGAVRRDSGEPIYVPAQWTDEDPPPAAA